MRALDSRDPMVLAALRKLGAGEDAAASGDAAAAAGGDDG